MAGKDDENKTMGRVFLNAKKKKKTDDDDDTPLALGEYHKITKDVQSFLSDCPLTEGQYHKITKDVQCYLSELRSGPHKRASCIELVTPLRIYKQPHADRSMIGSDLQSIGDEHAHSDRPFLIEGRVTIKEERDDRLKVTGKARLEAGGAMFWLNGWIEKQGVT